jgi:hypothetical protein
MGGSFVRKGCRCIAGAARGEGCEMIRSHKFSCGPNLHPGRSLFPHHALNHQGEWDCNSEGNRSRPGNCGNSCGPLLPLMQRAGVVGGAGKEPR